MAKKKILLVDDTVELAENLSDILSMEGYDVMHASNGEVATQWLETNTPDIIITDVVMPKMDGLQLVTWVRSNPSITGIPVIVLSARAMDQAVSEGLAAGANLYLKKPCDIDYLLDAIKMLIDNGA